MRLTLLKMVQLILSSMDSDEVNDVADTAEAAQVMDIIESVYYELASYIDLPSNWDFFELLPSNDPSKPTLMSIPSNVINIERMQYDHTDGVSTSARKWVEVYPLDRWTFFQRMNSLSTEDPTVYQYDYKNQAQTFDVRGRNNDFPHYYTTPNNRTIIFDNYNLEMSQTLVSDKTKAYGMMVPVFERSNDFIPDLEPRQFSLLFNEAKAQCWANLKQAQNVKAEQMARRGWIHSKMKQDNTPVSEIRPWQPNYGRRRYR